MGYSVGGNNTDSPPPTDGPLAVAIAVLPLVTAGLCVGWLLVAMW